MSLPVEVTQTTGGYISIQFISLEYFIGLV